MSKKFKKLLCGLLACAMISTSGIMAMADEPADTDAASAAVEASASPAAETEAPADSADLADATEAPAEEAEATEEPEETAAPSGKYDDDNYYKKALALCSALGIITGYDDGSIQPESNVTRAEMSAIVLRLLNLQSTTTYRNLFTDVSADHWAADTIQTASDSGVINGMGDGTFNPDGNVLYEQAVKMLVCAMNFGDQAELSGGYPNGYIAVASNNLSLLTSATSSIGSVADRGLIIKLAYNALMGPYNEFRTDENGNPTYVSNETLAKAKFDVIEEKGMLTATSKTSVTNTKPADGQIIIDGEIYLCDLTGLEDYISQNITYYYIDDGKADPKVIAVVPDSGKTDTVEIDADDIEEISGISTSAGTIETYSNRNYKVSDAYIVYNGDVIDAAMYSAAVNEDSERFAKRDYDGKEIGGTMSFDEFLKPKSGTIKLVDNNSDGKYDAVFVTSSENLVITAATDTKVTGKINNAAVSIDVDNEAQDKTITVIREGDEVKTKNLKKNDVASFLRNLDGDIMTFEVTGESITGSVESVRAGNEDTPSKARINGTEYIVDANAVNDCTSGIEGTFYLDKYNRIGYVDSDTVISSSEKYGWIVNSYMDESGDDYKVTIYSQDGKSETYTFAKNVSYWAPNATEAVTLSKEDIADELPYVKYNTVSANSTSLDIRLVKYSANSRNEITKLYCATIAPDGYKKDSVYSDSAKTYDKKALVMSNTNLTNETSTGNMNGDYYMSDGMLEFVVPNTNEDMSNASNYSAGTTTASAYINKENSIGKDFIVGEFSDSNQTYPTVVIRYQGASTNAALTTDYGTADNNPVMVVKEVMTGVDEDLEPVYTIVGYTNGGEVSYTTTQNTLLTKMTSAFGGSRDYNSTPLWDAVNGARDERPSMYANDQEFIDFIGEGDVIGVKDNGRVLMMMVDASEFVEGVQSGSIPTLYNSQNPGVSSSRDNLYMGMVSDSDMGENAIMSVAGYKCVFDNSRAMDTVVVSANGSIEVDSANVSTIADVIDYDEETNTGDFAFVRYANKGTLQEVILFRFED